MATVESASALQIAQAIPLHNKEALRHFVAGEIQDTKILRITESSEIEFAPKQRQFVGSILAAELFPDGKEPVLLVAEDESETHEALRKRCPSSAPRISGELYTLKRFAHIRFFSLDPVVLTERTTLFLPTETQLDEVVAWLFDQNIVPVDARYEIILPDMLD